MLSNVTGGFRLTLTSPFRSHRDRQINVFPPYRYIPVCLSDVAHVSAESLFRALCLYAYFPEKHVQVSPKCTPGSRISLELITTKLILRGTDIQRRKPTMQMLRIVVTGCSGNVGRRVVQEALREGHTVIGVDKVSSIEQPVHPNFSFMAADLRDFDATLQALKGCDAVIHLAAFPNPGDYAFTVHNLYVRKNGV